MLSRGFSDGRSWFRGPLFGDQVGERVAHMWNPGLPGLWRSSQEIFVGSGNE